MSTSKARPAQLQPAAFTNSAANVAAKSAAKSKPAAGYLKAGGDIASDSKAYTMPQEEHGGSKASKPPSKGRPAELHTGFAAGKVQAQPRQGEDVSPMEPQVFEMDAGDTTSEEASVSGTPVGSNQKLDRRTLAKATTSSSNAAPRRRKLAQPSSSGSHAPPGLSPDELQDYERIESQFKAFRTRQMDLESSVATLLTRLNTQVRIPSSVASSDCADLTSVTSSEWDSESIGMTEDGLSILGSHAGTPSMGSPRDSEHLPPMARIMQRGDSFPRTSFNSSMSSKGPMSWEELQDKLRKASEVRSSGTLLRQSVESGINKLSSEKLSAHDRSASSSAPAPGDDAHAAPQQERQGVKTEQDQTQEAESAQAVKMPPAAAEGPPVAPDSGPPPRKAVTTPERVEGADQVDESLEIDSRGGSENMGKKVQVQADIGSETTLKSMEALRPECTRSPSGQPEKTPESSTAEASPAFADRVAASHPPAPVQTPPPKKPQPAAPKVPTLALNVNVSPPPLGVNGAKLGVRDTPRGFGETPRGESEEELARWKGWSIIATPEGRLFFFKEQGHISEWSQPEELNNVLGEWEESPDEYEPGRRYWRNELLGISLWRDPRATTNIFQAALDGNLFFLQMYAEVEGNLSVLDARGRSALHYAAAGGAAMSALFLLQHNVEVNLQDEDDATPLIFSCRYGYASVVKVLLDARAEIHQQDSDGNTALHGAAAMGQLDCCNLLLLCGAEMRIPNNRGDTPEGLAARKNVSLSMLQRYQYHMVDGLPTIASPSVLKPGTWATEDHTARHSTQLPTAPGTVEEESESAEDESSSGSDAMRGVNSDGEEIRSQVGFGLWSRIWGNADGGRPSLANSLLAPFRRAVQADLGEPNRYVYNKDDGQWELRR